MATRATAAALAVPLACIMDEGSMDAVVSEACRRARLPTSGCDTCKRVNVMATAMVRLMIDVDGLMLITLMVRNMIPTRAQRRESFAQRQCHDTHRCWCGRWGEQTCTCF